MTKINLIHMHKSLQCHTVGMSPNWQSCYTPPSTTISLTTPPPTPPKSNVVEVTVKVKSILLFFGKLRILRITDSKQCWTSSDSEFLNSIFMTRQHINKLVNQCVYLQATLLPVEHSGTLVYTVTLTEGDNTLNSASKSKLLLFFSGWTIQT